MVGFSKYSKPKYKKYVSNILGMIIIIFLVWYLYENKESFQYLKNIAWYHIVLIIIIDLGMFFINSLLNYTMIKRLEPRIKFFDVYMLLYVNNLLNKILPTIGGGAAFRALYLKQKYNFSYTNFISTFTGLYIISFFTTSLIGLICMIIIFLQSKVYNLVLIFSFLFIFCSTLSVILFSPKLPNIENRYLKILNNILQEWGIIKNEAKFIMIFSFFSIFLLVLTSFQTMISYLALGVQTFFVPMVLLSTLGIFMAFLSFTPDGIGIKEGLYIFTSDLVQIPDNILVLGSLVLRVISIITAFLIGGISYWILMRQLKNVRKDGV